MSRTLAPFILFCLCIAVAISSAAKLPNVELNEQWPDTYPIFLGAVALCMVALVWWHKAIHSGRTTQGSSQHLGVTGLFELLRQCEARAQQIKMDMDQLDAPGLCDRMDSLLLETLHPFVEQRYVLIDEYGMFKASNILLQAAHAERLFNRVWSAASDQCLAEAHVSFDQALSVMKTLVGELETTHMQ